MQQLICDIFLLFTVPVYLFLFASYDLHLSLQMSWQFCNFTVFKLFDLRHKFGLLWDQRHLNLLQLFVQLTDQPQQSVYVVRHRDHTVHKVVQISIGSRHVAYLIIMNQNQKRGHLNVQKSTKNTYTINKDNSSTIINHKYRKQDLSIKDSTVENLQLFRLNFNSSQRTTLFSLYVVPYTLQTVDIPGLFDHCRIFQLFCTDTTITVFLDVLFRHRRTHLDLVLRATHLFLLLLGEIPSQHFMTHQQHHKPWFLEKLQNRVLPSFLLRRRPFKMQLLKAIKQMIPAILFVGFLIEVPKFMESLQKSYHCVKVGIYFFEDFLQQFQSFPIDLVSHKLVVVVIKFVRQVREDSPYQRTFESTPFAHLTSLKAEKAFSVGGSLCCQSYKVLQKVNKCSNFLIPISKWYQGRVRIEDCIDKIAYARPKVLLKHVNLQVLEEMQSFLAINDTLHLLYFCILHHSQSHQK